MIKRTEVVIAEKHNPYFNIAMEEYLTLHGDTDTITLFLWQNEHTIVIGRNQNAFTQVKVSEFQKNNGNLVRRLSGGGAVYHDLGNLNFTFIMDSKYFDVRRQSKVILNSLKQYGLEATFSGRNDLIIDQKKFSGNAYYHHQGRSYHHGTLLVNVEMDTLSRYLNVSLQKLSSNAVQSIKSRVTNLSALNPDITVDSLKQHLVKAFADEYHGELSMRDFTTQELEFIETRSKHFASDDWNFNPRFKATFEQRARFAWAETAITLEVVNNTITNADIDSDVMISDFTSEFKHKLLHSPFEFEAIKNIISTLNIEPDWKDDLASLFMEKQHDL